MSTDDLIARLALNAGPAKRLFIGRDIAVVLLLGMMVCSAISLGVRGLVPEVMWTGAALWTKLTYAAALAATSAWLLHILAFPGKRGLWVYRLMVLVGLCMATAGIISVMNVPVGERTSSIMGKYALICPWAIPLLSLPTMFGLLHLTKRFAPTELRWTGFVAGLLAGAIAAAGYALSCKEEAIGFVAVWYSLGILFSAGIGAAAGPRLLRW